MKKSVLAASCLLLSLVCFSQSAEDNARQVLKLSGAVEMSAQIMGQMLESFKKAAPEVPEEFWNGFAKETASADKFVEMLVPIYVKHYTNDELLQLIQFYKSPIGKTLVQKSSLIAKESYGVGEQWGKEVAAEVIKKLGENKPKN